jgi:NhaA family Na+:H+ antiporter
LRQSGSLQALRQFLRAETFGGVLLGVATLIALLWANINFSSYDSLWSQPVDVAPEGWKLSPRAWVNDAAMAAFFFVVGLELKREFVAGELRRPRHAALPVLAAAGGMVVPAALYLAFTHDTARGWGIPMATDIAFAIGVLTLLGPRVSTGLKVFLLSVAIVDDIGAILVIAFFYSGAIDGTWLAGAGVTFVSFWAAWRFRPGRSRVRAVILFVTAIAAWIATHESGVHATIAGVVLGLLVPADRPALSPAERLEHALHPWTSFVIVPVFALANAGIQLGIEALQASVMDRISLGVFVGLVVGKPLGIAGAARLAVMLRIAVLPRDVGWTQILGAAALGGIGFTVSLFITQLAFAAGNAADSAKLAIVAASLVAAGGGYGLLRLATKPAVRAA